MTFAPIDLDGIEPSCMTQREKQLLNDYHELVYKELSLSPELTKEEQEWLYAVTRPVL